MKTFTNNSELPRLTEHGFKLIDLPEDIKNLLFDFYKLLQPYKKREEWPNMHDSFERNPVDFFDIANAPSWKKLLEEKMQPLMEEWIGYKEEIVPYAAYGIRSYNKGMTLGAHCDKAESHHVSGIVIIDREGANWPLDIQDHNGKWHKIYAEPGQMIFYEGAVCAHGRLETLDGLYFRNCLFHYSLKNWTYSGDETWEDFFVKTKYM